MHVKCTFCRPSYLVCNWKQTVTWFYFLYVPTSLLLFVEFSWRFWLSRANKRCKWILKLNRETCYLLYKRKPQSYIHYNNNNAICIYARMYALFIVWENLCRQAALRITNVSSLLQRQAFFPLMYFICFVFYLVSRLLFWQVQHCKELYVMCCCAPMLYMLRLLSSRVIFQGFPNTLMSLLQQKWHLHLNMHCMGQGKLYKISVKKMSSQSEAVTVYAFSLIASSKHFTFFCEFSCGKNLFFVLLYLNGKMGSHG